MSKTPPEPIVNPLLEAALGYASHGFPVFPVKPREKRPLTDQGFKNASTDETQVRDWWKRWPNANIGVPTGPASKLLVVDVDPRHRGDVSLSKLIEAHGPLPPTAKAHTGGGGQHIFFSDPGIPVGSTLAEGVDLKCAGGYIVVAPSVHASGKAYKWESDGSVEALTKVAAAPHWLLSLAVKGGPSPRNADTVAEGGRNSKLTSIAGKLRQKGAPAAVIEAKLQEENKRVCHPPLDEEEVSRIAESVAKYPTTAEYESTDRGLIRNAIIRNHATEVRLTNYRASIVGSITFDDGVETSLELSIEAELNGRKRSFSLSGPRFFAMDWDIPHLGPRAITYPNQKDHARTAIQETSDPSTERHVYRHTGWRQFDGQWFYLHAGGAIGADGHVADKEVQLTGALSRYELRLPGTHADRKAAVLASLKLFELGPSHVSFPLHAATYRAVLGGADFSIFVVGQTGAFKSELAALEQQHFGAAMDRLHLPANWASTANAIEMIAFSTKDALVTVDDFAPQGSVTDINRIHGNADRVFRGVGNQAGRARMDSNTRLREPKPPRGLVVATGEDLPRGHSVRARLLIVEVSKGEITSRKLAESQAQAKAGVYAEAMGSYIRWLAADWEGRLARFKDQVELLRRELVNLGGHARTLELIANLQAGVETFLDFAVECEAIDVEDREALASRCLSALRAIAVAQLKHAEAAEPAQRFMELLQSCLSSGRGHLAGCDNKPPAHHPEACGWRTTGENFLPLGDCLGWIDDDFIYLEPVTSYRVANASANSVGEPIPVQEKTLRRRLNEKKLLAQTDPKRGTLTVRKTINGLKRDVLVLHREVLLSEEPDKPDISDILDSEPVADPSGERGHVGLAGRETDEKQAKPDIESTNGINGLQANVGFVGFLEQESVPEPPQSSHLKSRGPYNRNHLSGSPSNPTSKPDILPDEEEFSL